MSKYRPPSSKSKYFIPKEDYLCAIHYSLRYPAWKKELEAMANTARGIAYDTDKVQTSGNYDSTFEAAVRISESDMQRKIKIIDDTITLVADGLDFYLCLAVCYGFNFDQLKGKGMPCERDKFYLIRRHYYYELSKKI